MYAIRSYYGANHEQLPYPIARFASAFLPSPGNEGQSVLRNRMFWTSCGFVLAIYVWNYINGWFPNLVPVKTYISFHPLGRLFPTFVNRITSYNVCYTKLLRIAGTWTTPPVPSGWCSAPAAGPDRGAPA